MRVLSFGSLNSATGDTFTGYFIASIINGEAPENALKISAKASSITVTRNGALDSIPTYEEVMAGEKRHRPEDDVVRNS